MLCNISQNAMGQPRGVPCQVQPWGYPARSSQGVPWPGGYPGWGGTLAGGVPWLGGYPGQGGTLAGGYPCWGGTLAGGVPWLGGYPGGGGTQLGQHREYLLHGGQYASCVHAGGLSCSFSSFVKCVVENGLIEFFQKLTIPP